MLFFYLHVIESSTMWSASTRPTYHVTRFSTSSYYSIFLFCFKWAINIHTLKYICFQAYRAIFQLFSIDNVIKSTNKNCSNFNEIHTQNNQINHIITIIIFFFLGKIVENWDINLCNKTLLCQQKKFKGIIVFKGIFFIFLALELGILSF